MQTNWDAPLSKVPKNGDFRMFYRIWYDQLYIYVIDYGFVQNGKYRKMVSLMAKMMMNNWILEVISLVEMEIS